MEDAHISSLDIGDGVALFGVFDGHGGQLIHSLYTSQRHYYIRSLILILTIFSSFRCWSGSVCCETFYQGVKEAWKFQEERLQDVALRMFLEDGSTNAH